MKTKECPTEKIKIKKIIGKIVDTIFFIIFALPIIILIALPFLVIGGITLFVIIKLIELFISSI